jgi:hypothetical protein
MIKKNYRFNEVVEGAEQPITAFWGLLSELQL